MLRPSKEFFVGYMKSPVLVRLLTVHNQLMVKEAVKALNVIEAREERTKSSSLADEAALKIKGAVEERKKVKMERAEGLCMPLVLKIKSREGVQQGDPLGPLLFSLGLKSLTERISREVDPILNAWFFDDGTIAGYSEQIKQVIKILEEDGPSIGLRLNRKKSVLYWPAFSCGRSGYYSGLAPNDAGFSRDFVRAIGGSQACGGLTCLGAPLGSPQFIQDVLNEVLQRSQAGVERLHLLDDPQVAFSLLRNCAGFCRINYLNRALDCQITHKIAKNFDKVTISALARIIGAPSLSDLATIQAQLPIKNGGLGLFKHSSAARVSSINANKLLVEAILERALSEEDGPAITYSDPSDAIQTFMENTPSSQPKPTNTPFRNRYTSSSWSLSSNIQPSSIEQEFAAVKVPPDPSSFVLLVSKHWEATFPIKNFVITSSLALALPSCSNVVTHVLYAERMNATLVAIMPASASLEDPILAAMIPFETNSMHSAREQPGILPWKELSQLLMVASQFPQTSSFRGILPESNL